MIYIEFQVNVKKAILLGNASGTKACVHLEDKHLKTFTDEEKSELSSTLRSDQNYPNSSNFFVLDKSFGDGDINIAPRDGIEGLREILKQRIAARKKR